MSARIRRAETADADALTSLAQSSKAFWGYDAAFMEACRAELTLDDRDMVDDPTFMIEAEGRVLGFYQLRLQGAGADMRMLFVAPEAVRSGIGRRLGPHLERTARAIGVHAPRGRQRSPRGGLLSRDAHGAHRPSVIGQHRRPHAAGSGEGPRSGPRRPRHGCAG